MGRGGGRPRVAGPGDTAAPDLAGGRALRSGPGGVALTVPGIEENEWLS
jgi:hypothetical protein